MASPSTTASSAEPQVDGAAPLATSENATALPSDATWASAGDFQVSGGTAGTDSGNPGDYYFADNILHICSSTPLTVKNADGKAATAQTIQIDAGVKADLTLAGVNIVTTARSPINLITNSDEDGDGVKATHADQIKNKTMLYLSLADGSENVLNSVNAMSWPGIRCGWGSILIVDDQRANVIAGGSKFNLDDIVTPANGMAAADATLLDGTTLKKGDTITTMDSADPGTLKVNGGGDAAGIGSGPRENAGTLVFNGGKIDAKVLTGPSTNTYGFGSAIGGGSHGSGTVIVINGGHVSAAGGYCGTAIGAGFGYHLRLDRAPQEDAIAATDSITTFQQADGLTFFSQPSSLPLYTYRADSVNDLAANTVLQPGSTHSFTVAGDITINGGYVYARSPVHGNAIGQPCGHGVGTNREHLIRIAGGTVVTKIENRGATNPYMFSIGARLGYTLVTGGSVFVETGTSAAYKDKVLFQGIGGTAYNTRGIETWDDVIAKAGGNPISDAGYTGHTLPDGDRVYMLEIDLSDEFDKAAGENSTVPITKWKLEIDNVEYDYGAPTYLQEGKAYVWVPESAKATDTTPGKSVAITLSYRDDAGVEHNIEPLYVKEVGGDEGSTLKRYIDIDVDKLSDAQKAYFASLHKTYDGLPFTAFDIANHPIDTTPFEENGKTLDQADAVTTSFQRYTSADGNGKPASHTESGSTMPADAGIYNVTLLSEQYTTEYNSYWGHRISAWATIDPIASVVKNVKAEWVDETDESKKPGSSQHPASYSLKVSADINRAATIDGMPGSAATAGTCAAPEGNIQLYVNDKPVGSPIPLAFAESESASLASTFSAAQPFASKAGAATNATAISNGEGGSYTHFEYTFKPSETDYLVPNAATDNTHMVSVRFQHPTDSQLWSGMAYNYHDSSDPVEDGDAEWVPVKIDPIDPTTSVTPDPAGTDPAATVDALEGPTATDPGADPTQPGDKTYTGEISTRLGEPTEADPHPGRVTLNIHTTSTAPLSITDGNGGIIKASFLCDENGEPIRNDDGSYTLVIDPAAVGIATLVVTQQPNGAHYGTTWKYQVTVKADPSVAPVPSVKKTASNLTHPDGPTQPGDRILYTVTAANAAAGSAWLDATITDDLPACVTLDESSVRLENSRAGFSGTLQKAALAASGIGQFSLSPTGTLTVPAGTIFGGSEAVLAFECLVKDDSAGRDVPPADLTNVASASGSKYNPDDPDGDPVPLPDEKSEEVVPPGGSTVVPADPTDTGGESGGASAIRIAKTVQNLTDEKGRFTHIGDRLLYTITMENTGSAASMLKNASICDPLPVGVNATAGTFKLSLNGATPEKVADACYDAASHTVHVAVGDLWGGESAELTFECTVAPEAAGTPMANVAQARGEMPSTSEDPTAPEAEPGTPLPAPPATEPPVAETPGVEPQPVLPDDTDDGDVAVEKTARNTSRSDGTTHVGDTIRYTVTTSNNHVGTGWIDAVVKDEIPRGLEPIAGTLKLTLNDGTTIAVADEAYDPATRIMGVTAGRLYGGQHAVLEFDALVTEEALDADIGNVAKVFGTQPSDWDPDAGELEPGKPFQPEEGWPSFERNHAVAVSDPAYPDGVTRAGGVLPGDADESNTVRMRLAQTSDALTRIVATCLLAALAAAAMASVALAARRSRRRAKRR